LLFSSLQTFVAPDFIFFSAAKNEKTIKRKKRTKRKKYHPAGGLSVPRSPPPRSLPVFCLISVSCSGEGLSRESAKAGFDPGLAAGVSTLGYASTLGLGITRRFRRARFLSCSRTSSALNRDSFLAQVCSRDHGLAAGEREGGGIDRDYNGSRYSERKQDIGGRRSSSRKLEWAPPRI